MDQAVMITPTCRILIVPVYIVYVFSMTIHDDQQRVWYNTNRRRLSAAQRATHET